MMKVLIIDDDIAAQNVLRMMLAEYFPEQLDIIGAAANIPTGVKLIHNHKPALVFLDVNMPGQNGFRLFDYFEAPGFQVIFTTAFPEYALKAFEVAALDYLVKPIRMDKLKAAVMRALKAHAPSPDIVPQVGILETTLAVNHIHKIALPVRDRVVFVKVDDLVYLQAEGVYTHVVTKGQKLLLSKKLKDFEYILNEDIRFSRIHRSYIVNVKYVKEYIKHEGTRVLMENGDTIPVSKERRIAFEDLIKNVLIGPSFK